MATWGEVKSEIREMLQDPNGKKWIDEDIEEWMNEAQLEYVRIAGSLRKTMEIVPDVATQTYIYPTDFLEFVYGYNYDGIEILPATYDELRDNYGDGFYDDEGLPNYIYDDDGTDSTYKLYPSPKILDDTETDLTFEEQPDGYGIIQYFTFNGEPPATIGDDYGLIYEYGERNSDVTVAPQYGTVQSTVDFEYDPELGVTIDNGLGVEYQWEDNLLQNRLYPDLWFLSYGEIVDAIYLEQLIGRIQYIRRPLEDAIEIADVEAIKYWVVATAYMQESAWKDEDYASAVMAEFEDLVYKDSPVAEIKQSNIQYF